MAMMGLNEYQKWAESTAIYEDQGEQGGLIYAIMGMVGEAGELANEMKKILRDDNTTTHKRSDMSRATKYLTRERRDKMVLELGDVLWYIAAVARELNVAMSNVAQANVIKLMQRMAENTVHGR